MRIPIQDTVYRNLPIYAVWKNFVILSFLSSTNRVETTKPAETGRPISDAAEAIDRFCCTNPCAA